MNKRVYISRTNRIICNINDTLGGLQLYYQLFNQYNHVQNTARTPKYWYNIIRVVKDQLGYATSTINIVTTKSDDYDIIEFDDKDW